MLKACWACGRCLKQLQAPLRYHSIQIRSIQTGTRHELPPKLLARARAITEEHARLSKQLERQYDAQLAKKTGELSRTAFLLKEVEGLRETLDELNALLHDQSTDKELRELASDDINTTLASLARRSASLTSSLVPKHPFEHLPCLLEIRPGAGGSEAALFAGDLFRMYRSYCANNGLHYNVLKYEDIAGTSDPNGSDAPLQEAILEVTAEGAYGLLRSESGVHRVQRVPATETKGRVHTSAASVLVLPSFPENSAGEQEDVNDPDSDFYVDPKDVRHEAMRHGGAGGQHANKTESAVRLTHVPTGIVVSMRDSRSQIANREKAWRLLRSRIALGRREARDEDMVKLRRSTLGVAKVDRNDKVRTYNWGQQRITDHRSGFTTHGLNDALEGGTSLQELMDSVKQWMIDQEIELLIDSDGSSGR